MATIPKKTPTSSSTPGRSSPAGGATSPSPGPRRSGTGAAPSTPSNGIARARSVRTPNGAQATSRTAAKKPAGASELKNSTSASDTAEEDARMESSALVEDLKERLQQTEQMSEEFKKQVEVLQARLDEAIQEQGKLEDKLHEEEERVEGLENEKRESVRQKRELETIYEAERAATMKEREATQVREEELQSIIQRLKESLSQKERGGPEDGRLSRTASSPTLETGFAPPSSLQRSNSRNNSKLILQKDQLIESLRLELAEVQIKLVEMENMGDASRRVQELERTVLEQRMTNARLMEDIDSYQLLLSERTLNGDFSRNDLLRSSPAPEDRTGSRGGQPTTLADELSSIASDEGESASDNADVKRLQGEVQTLKDSNKALTLYINKIIDRILQHQGGYENILSNADDDAPAGAQRPPPPPPNKDKDLPPPPPPKEAGPSFLQRASSVVYGKGDKPKRPQSAVIQPQQPSVTEDVNTAPSIPLNRTASKRMTVDLSSRRRSTQIDQHAAAIVSNMYRGPSSEHGPASPSIVSPRTSFFGMRQPSGNPPTVSSIREDGLDDSDEDSSAANRKSALDALTGSDASPQRRPARSPSKNRDSSTTASEGVPSVDTPSPPRSMLSREDRTNTAGGVMTGNKMRPLRLVKEAEEESKANKRTSWAVPANIAQGISGWWNKEGQSKEGGGPTSSGAPGPAKEGGA